VNASKFGEPFPNGNAEPSLDIFKEGVETWHSPPRTGEGKVRTTNWYFQVAKVIVVRKSDVERRVGSNPTGGTIYW